MTNRYEALLRRLRRGERILLDGGTGTELERRGVPVVADAWSGGGAMTHPDVVRQVHADYIAAGARIVISNTFATSRHALTDAGMSERFEALNRRGVQLAREARANADASDVLVAGGVTHWSWTGDHPPLDELRDGVAAQTAIMADAGADLIMLEMMADVDRFRAVLDGARRSRRAGDRRLLWRRTRAHPSTPRSRHRRLIHAVRDRTRGACPGCAPRRSRRRGRRRHAGPRRCPARRRRGERRCRSRH